MLDNASITALVKEHGKWLMAYLRGLCDTLDDAEDAFQEAWLRVMRSRSEVPNAWKSYLVKTARSVVIDKLRRKHQMESLDVMMETDDGGSVDDALIEDEASPDERYESKATSEDVRRAIAALPINWREVVLMRIEGEMEFKDIAKDLGVPLGTVLTWMHNATKELKAKLGGRP